ncbi:hypothetical protein FHS25_005189 [Rhizobium laguerreae]|uniref:DNA primase/polymerase bifunctional N-terminal domain-containing protein n=1 Tax=Rhizobium laguerreae TaxID=1076926 RepID=A0ABR6GFN1_9HYPH|nr:DUF5906 domain-containing protein [Rhizobium laguerreae]MBB3164686.1 hypothetical protein [Rhizobium laguerreae]OOO46403.1 hypothetical protein BS630_25445 [Rhizobium laguerreae]
MTVAFPYQLERLAKAGFALHWLHPKSKRPIGNDWAAKPVASLSELNRTYRDGNNVGVRLGKWSKVDDLYCHVVDLDIRVGEEVDIALSRLEKLFPDYRCYPVVQSGSMGESRHFYILSDKAFSSKKLAHSSTKMLDDEGKEHWTWEIELFGTGKQVAIPPSIHPVSGKPYRWLREIDFDLLDMGLGPIVPSAYLTEITEARDEEDAGESGTERQQPLGLDEDEIIAVLDDLPAAEWFEDREGWYRVGMALHHETDGSDEGFDLWCKYSKISEKFDPKDQKRVWKSFKNRAAAPFRMASLVAVAREVRAERQLESIEDDFDEIEEVDDSRTDMFDDLLGAGNGPEKAKLSKSQLKLKKAEVEFELGRGAPPKIARMNKRFAVARVSSKTVIMDFHDDNTVTYGSVNDLHNFHENDRVPKDGTTEPVSKQWMRSKHRRSYPNGIVFAPNRDVEGAYNHWQGFSVEPDDSKSCALFMDHLLRIFCNGNEDHFWYLIGWLAHMVQKPEEKPGVAVIAIGKKGAGKDTISDYVGGLFTNHYVTVGNQEQMTGKFNAHQERCLLLSVQEGFWAGDKKAEGQLKYLITSNNVMIEPKGMNAFPIKSVLRLFISSNERWVVPATQDERRFFVVNVSSERCNDHKYFEALRKEMENGGREALLAYLMDYDISDFQVRAVPDTEALAEQKVEGLKNVERWWHGVLYHGAFEGMGHSMEDAWPTEHLRVVKSEFRDAYTRWFHKQRYQGLEASEVAFSKTLKGMLPQFEPLRVRDEGRRLHVCIIPPLPTCRAEFDTWLGAELDWPEDLSAIDLPRDSRNTFISDDLFN